MTTAALRQAQGDTLAPTSLNDLAELINESYQQILEAQNALLPGVSRYLNAKRQTGEYLLQAKSQVMHGQWLPWLSVNCPHIAERTAHTYMFIAKNWEKTHAMLTDVKKSAESADLNISDFLELVKENNEVIDAELVEEEDEKEIGTVVPQSTPANQSVADLAVRLDPNRYKPVDNDIVRIHPDASKEFGGKLATVYNVIDEVIVSFETDDGQRSSLLNQEKGTFEFVGRAEPKPETEKIASSKPANTRMPSRSSGVGEGNEPNHSQSKERGDILENYYPATLKMLAWMCQVMEAVELPKALWDKVNNELLVWVSDTVDTIKLPGEMLVAGEKFLEDAGD